jgi:Family of unknown function (DUF6599)
MSMYLNLQSLPLRVFFIICPVLFLWTSCSAQTTAISSLPPTVGAALSAGVKLPGELAGFAREENSLAVYDHQTMWQRVNGASHQYIRLGAKTLTSAWYRKSADGGRMLVEIFQMNSVEAAIAIYKLEHAPDGEEIGVGDSSSLMGNFLFFRSGRFYTRLTTYFFDEQTTSLLKTVGKEMHEILNREG